MTSHYFQNGAVPIVVSAPSFSQPVTDSIHGNGPSTLSPSSYRRDRVNGMPFQWLVSC